MYIPNFNDPRVLKRARQAYGFARGCLSATKPRAWVEKALAKNFGQQQNELSAWLRSKLLICTNESYSVQDHHCKEYILNAKGAEEVKALLLGEKQIPTLEQTVLEHGIPKHLLEKANFTPTMSGNDARMKKNEELRLFHQI